MPWSTGDVSIHTTHMAEDHVLQFNLQRFFVKSMEIVIPIRLRFVVHSNHFPEHAYVIL